MNPEALVPGTEIYIPYGFDLVPSDVRWTSKLNELVLEGLKLRYPFIGTETYGKSVMGRPLRAVSIGAGSAEAFFNASHHANEWITTPLVLKFAENYLKAYINGSSIFGRDARELFAKTRLFIAPLVNPDGVDLVNGALDETTPLWQSVKRIARQYPAVPFPSGWKANIEGTDLNLNYPAGWIRQRKRNMLKAGFRPHRAILSALSLFPRRRAAPCLISPPITSFGLSLPIIRRVR